MAHRRKLAGGFLTTVLVLLALPVVPAAAAPPSRQAHEASVGTCVDLARSSVQGAWTCVGAQLSFETREGGTALWLHQRTGPLSSNATLTTSPVPFVDDYDTWCETSGTCIRFINDYIAEIKGNLTYGVGSEVYGTFDVIWRQAFDGDRNRYRLLLDWDSGAAVDSDYWHAAVREEKTGLPDPTTGYLDFFPAVISSLSTRAWKPSSTGFTYVSGAGVNSSTATHHDDLYGSFFARGVRFGAGSLHLPDFKCPLISGAKVCRYLR